LWDEFFKKFDEANLALVYEKETASGEPSYFYRSSVARRPKPRSTAKPTPAGITAEPVRRMIAPYPDFPG